MNNSPALRVTTLGGFSIAWQGNTIGYGAKSADSQYTRLLQILLHYRERGVDRVQLQELLFEDSKADDIHHLLRTVIYNTRRKLKKAGLPDVNYIEFRDGNYYWTDEIAVEEDAAEFEALYELAKAEEQTERRTELFMDACYYYKGDFLPQQTRLVWVAQEERRYKAIFNYCAEQAVSVLRDQHRWTEMERLGRHASSVSPLNEWETVTMEALIAMGKYRAAQQLYEEAVEYYQRELGIKPSLDMVTRLEAYAARIDQPYMQADLIQEQLNEPEDEITGGYFCSYHVFRGIYRMMSRTMDRCGRCAFLMICSIRNNGTFDDGGRAAPGESSMARLTERMKTTICRSVRKSDIICRYGQGQFLMILMNRTPESCEIVKDRINRNFRTEGFDLTIEYRISPVKTV